MIEFSREQISEEFKIRLYLTGNKTESACFDYRGYIDGKDQVSFDRSNICDPVIQDIIQVLTSLKDRQIMTFTAEDNEKLMISSTSVDDASMTYIISNTANCTIAAATIDTSAKSSILEFRDVTTGQSICLEDLYSILYMMNLCNEARKLTFRFINEWS